MSVSQGDTPPPGTDTWVAAIHENEDGRKVLGSGFLIDSRRVITCAHVAGPGWERNGGLWVALPKAGDLMHRRIRVSKIALPSTDHDIRDVSVLFLEESVPSELAARLRRPSPGDLIGDTWWSFGFPEGDILGSSSRGTIGDSLAYGWIRLDSSSGYPVKRGYSGAALWSSRYQAVVGLIGQAQPSTGNARALTLWQAEKALPEENISLLTEWTAEAAGESALAAWGWSLDNDPESGRHWRPRARGVNTEAERGYRFCGRQKALSEIISWITNDNPQRRALVVTGSPGVGKSAVLGRIVTTADAGVTAALPRHDSAARAPVGSVACAVHAKGMTAIEVARDIARAASAPMCETVSDLVPSLRAALSSQPARHFAVIIDALDEATSPKEARAIITEIIRPLVESCTDLLVHVVAGTRKKDDAGDILAGFGPTGRFINLDEKRYSENEDLVAYARVSLQLIGDERRDNPYANDDVAGPIAARIAVLAGGNFLIAGLIARTHGLYDQDPVPLESLSIASDKSALDEALRTYLEQLPPVGTVPAVTALTALAYAEEPGFPFKLWSAAIEALSGIAPTERELEDFALSSAANFLIETNSSRRSAGAYRIFHQALNDVLLGWRSAAFSDVKDEREIALRFLKIGRADGWESAEKYLLRSLPRHASNGLLIDELLLDDAYILHADLRRLIPAAAHALSSDGRDRFRLLRKTPRAIDAAPNVRIAMLGITECQEKLGTTFQNSRLPTPYRAAWAAVAPQAEKVTLDGHTGKISGICEIQIGDAFFLATASDDRTVRVWDVSTGENVHTLHGHGTKVRGVCALTQGPTPMLVSISNECVNVWNPITSELVRSFWGQNNGVCGICSVVVAGQQLLASSKFEEVQIWDPLTGHVRHRLDGHQGIVHALFSTSAGGRSRLVSAGRDEVRVWDAETGELLHILQSHARHVSGVCVIEVLGRQVIIYSGVPDFEKDESCEENLFLIWDLESGERIFDLPACDARIDSICPVTMNGSRFLAVGTGEGVQIWDPVRGESITSFWETRHQAYALCPTRVGNRSAIAIAGYDAVQIWDPADADENSERRDGGQEVYALCSLDLPDGRWIAGASLGSVKVWDPHTGTVVNALPDHQGYVNAISPIGNGRGGDSLVIASQRVVSMWDVEAGLFRRVLTMGNGATYAICGVDAMMGSLVAVSESNQIWIMDPVSWKSLHRIDAHQDTVYAMCAARLRDGSSMLFSVDSKDLKAWEIDRHEPPRLRWSSSGGARRLTIMEVDRRIVLISASFDTVIVRDAESGELLRRLGIPQNSVNSLCPFPFAGRQLLATVHHDRTVRLWDIMEAGPEGNPWSTPSETWSKPLLDVHVRYRAPALVAVDERLVVGLSDGLLALSISPESFNRPARKNMGD